MQHTLHIIKYVEFVSYISRTHRKSSFMFTRERVGIYIYCIFLYTYVNVLHMEEYEMKWKEGEFFLDINRC